MPEFSAGEARLSIVPSAKGFEERLKAELSKVNANLPVQLHPANLAQASADIDRWIAQQSRKDVKISVDVDTKKASAKAKELEADLSKAFSALKWNSAAIGIGNLPAVATALTTVAGALQQVAQAGLAVPGILAGVGASAGTLALGLSGVSDAWTAIEKSSNQSGASQVRSADSVARSQRELTNAYRDSRHELEDLNLSLRGGQLSEQQAVINAQKARRDLRLDMANGQIKDQLDLQSRLLDIQQADQDVAESQQRNIELQEKANDANKKGIEGSDKVVSAHEAVASAAASSGAATDAVSQAMAKLAPSARDFLQTAIDLKPGWKDLQQTVQQNGFLGLSEQLRTLSDADLPHLKSGMGSIATAWNVTVKQLFTSLGSKSSQGFLDRILGNTADAQTRLSKAIDPVVHAIGTLSAAGAGALPRLADDVDRLATRFDAFITEADSDGRLDKWINDGITGVEQLADTLLNIGTSFTAITKAAGGGQGLLGILDQGSKKLSEFLNSTEGQNKLKDFFAEGKIELQHLWEILQQLPGIFKGVYNASKAWTDAILPPLAQITGFLGDHPRLIELVAKAFIGWKTINGVASLIDSLSKVSNLLKFTIPASAATAGTGIASALAGPIALVIAGAGSFDALLHKLDEKTGTNIPSTIGEIPGSAAWVYDRIVGNKPWLPTVVPSGQSPANGRVPTGPHQTGWPSPPTPASLPPSATNDIPGAKPGFPAPAPGSAPILPGPAVQPPAGSAPPLLWPNGPVPFQPKNPLLNGYAKGGPTLNQRNGPTGGYIAELHPDEWVLPAHARKAVGDKALWNLTNGRSFAPGGFIDPNGNPVTPGPAPGGPAPIAAADPATGGGVQSAFGSFLSGIQGPIGNALNIGSALANNASGQASPGAAGFTSKAAAIPGLWGLVAGASGANPAQDLSAWGQQTGQWLGSFTAKTLGGFGSALWQGGLDAIGLGGSILSPSNPWFQAGQQGAQFALGSDGPIGSLMGGVGSVNLGDTPQLGAQSITLGDGSTIQIPTYGTSQGVPGSAQASVAGAGSNLSQAAIQAISYAKTHAVGQKYQYGGVGNTGGYDCSGIASAIFAAATGRPEGTRYFTTESDFTSLGFQPGYQAGALNIGIMRGGGGPNSHMALTLPNGANVESGGASNSTQYGGSAAGALSSEFPIHYFLPLGGNQGVGSVPGVYAAGGPTPHGSGPLPDGGYPAVVHPGEFMISKRGRATVSDAFLHQLNAGQLKGFLPGGPIPDAAVIAPVQPGRPNFNPGTPARQLNPSGPAPSQGQPAPRPTPPPASVAPAVPSAPTAPAPPKYSSAGPAAIAPGPVEGGSGPYDHNLPALSKGITSGFAAAGQAAATALSLGAGAAAGAAGIPGIGAIGAAAPYIQGLFTQAGKITNDIVNVGSSFLVGNVPGSFGTNDNAYGQTNLPAQNFTPQTAPLRGAGGGSTYNFNGISDINRITQELDIRDAQHSQSALAGWRG